MYFYFKIIKKIFINSKAWVTIVAHCNTHKRNIGIIQNSRAADKVKSNTYVIKSCSEKNKLSRQVIRYKLERVACTPAIRGNRSKERRATRPRPHSSLSCLANVVLVGQNKWKMNRKKGLSITCTLFASMCIKCVLVLTCGPDNKWPPHRTVFCDRKRNRCNIPTNVTKCYPVRCG